MFEYKILPRTATLSEVKTTFSNSDSIDCIIVVSESNGGHSIEGLITRRDLRFLPNDSEKTIKQIMTTKDKLVTMLYTTDRQTLKEKASVLMDQHRIRRVVLVDEDFTFRGMIREGDIIKRKLRCFSILPFQSPYMDMYKDCIKPLFQNEFEITIEQGDEIFNTGSIIDIIQKRIESANFIIADVSMQNPNVYYEVGYSHALGKEIIFITQDINEVPFDIRNQRCLTYSYSDAGIEKFKEKLRKSLREIISNLPIEDEHN